MLKNLKPFVAVVLSLVLPSLSLATSMEHLSLDELIQQSDHVVVGKVKSQNTVWKSGALNTLVEVSVEDSLKGNASDTVEVMISGGRSSVAASGIVVSEISAETPVFINGVEVVLFLKPSINGGHLEIVGVSQGYIPVQNSASGQLVQMPSLDSRMPLESLKNRVRNAATH